MNPRKLAVQVLLRVVRDGQSLTAALESVLAGTADGSDRAFVQALCYGVCRYYQRLDFMLGLLLDKPLRNKDEDVRVLLLSGLYQLEFMRVKEHAAVSETVAAAGKKSWAKGLINGVLRQYQRERENIAHLVEQNEQARLSHPAWMIRSLKEDWQERADEIMTVGNDPAPMVLRVNPSKVTRDAYLERLNRLNLQAHAHACCPDAVVLDQATGVENLPGFADGCVSVQDGAAQLAAHLLELRPGLGVLDLCAAPGGKTSAILEREPSVASLLAVDIDERRLQKVGENLKRLQLEAELVCGDACEPGEWANGRLFDRILLDAPCSALGVIRRHPDIKLLRRESDIGELVKLQANILDAAWGLLKPGGLLLYATCSVLKRENERQMADFLVRTVDAAEVKIIADWGVERPVGRQILTGDRRMDGFYYARVRKTP